MSQLGIKVILNSLMGNEESVDVFTGAVGKTITALELKEDKLHFSFDDGSKMLLFDDGQSCCEDRYMTTDDHLGYHVGAVLMGAEIANAPNQPDEYGEHEVQFLRIKTSKGIFTMESHNKHNGYYGGFSIIAMASEES